MKVLQDTTPPTAVGTDPAQNHASGGPVLAAARRVWSSTPCEKPLLRGPMKFLQYTTPPTAVGTGPAQNRASGGPVLAGKRQKQVCKAHRALPFPKPRGPARSCEPMPKLYYS